MIYKAVELVSKWPLMFEVFSSKDLEILLKGYSTLSSSFIDFYDEDITGFNSFGYFISNKFQVNSKDWGNIIRCYSKSDWLSIFKCVELIKEFQNLTEESIKEVTINQQIFNDFYDLFHAIRETPNNYGIYSARELNVFLKGFYLYLSYNNNIEDMNPIKLAVLKIYNEDFKFFLMENLNMEIKDNVYFKYIDFIYYPQNPEYVLKQYFDLLEKYLFPS